MPPEESLIAAPAPTPLEEAKASVQDALKIAAEAKQLLADVQGFFAEVRTLVAALKDIRAFLPLK